MSTCAPSSVELACSNRGAHPPFTRADEDLPHDGEGRLLRPGVVWFNENLDEDVADKVKWEPAC